METEHKHDDTKNEENQKMVLEALANVAPKGDEPKKRGPKKKVKDEDIATKE